MPKYALPPTGAKNVEMQDGSKYRGKGTLKRGRVIEVDRTDHKVAIDRQEHIQRIADFSTPEDIEGRRCVACGFNGFKWQKVCPRDGAEMKEVEA